MFVELPVKVNVAPPTPKRVEFTKLIVIVLPKAVKETNAAPNVSLEPNGIVPRR